MLGVTGFIKSTVFHTAKHLGKNRAFWKILSSKLTKAP